MYDYRKWSEQQKQDALRERVLKQQPIHSPPHCESPDSFRLITGVCFEHKEILNSPEKLFWFESELLDHLARNEYCPEAWVILPNHYHLLLSVDNIKKFSKLQGRLHGRTSFELNKMDRCKGRQVWFRCSDRIMRSKSHYYTTLNYIHNNPVKHGYADKWGDWPYSSFHSFLEVHGRDWLVLLWRQFPVLDFGEKWDTY